MYIDDEKCSFSGTCGSSMTRVPLGDRHMALSLLLHLALQRATLSTMLTVITLLLQLWDSGRNQVIYNLSHICLCVYSYTAYIYTGTSFFMCVCFLHFFYLFEVKNSPQILICVSFHAIFHWVASRCLTWVPLHHKNNNSYTNIHAHNIQ